MLAQKYIVGAIVIAVTYGGMRLCGIGIGDVLNTVQSDAANAAKDIKTLMKGDFKQRNLGEQLKPKVGANEGDYDDDMKKDLAEERQKFLEERRKAIDKVVNTTLDQVDTDTLRKQIEKSVRDAAGKE